MKIAIPLAGGVLAEHFGHCEQFVMMEVDPAGRSVYNMDVLDAPPHEPGLLPRWLAERGAGVVIAGGMGSRARQLFEENGIEVVVGASGHDPEQIVESYLRGTLASGENICDH